MTGIAAASALATAIVAPPPSAASGAPQVVTAVLPAQAVQPTPSHITRYVTLAPGQTAPPQAAVQQLPAPSPRVVVVVTTRQSGRP